MVIQKGKNHTSFLADPRRKIILHFKENVQSGGIFMKLSIKSFQTRGQVRVFSRGNSAVAKISFLRSSVTQFTDDPVSFL